MKSLLFLLCFLVTTALHAQTDDVHIKKIFSTELSEGRSYEMLEYLSTRIGARLSGSPSAAAAVDWSRHTMREFADTVKLQPVMVPHWVRGEKEKATIISTREGVVDVAVCALGGSVGTGRDGISGNVIEVQGIDELRKLGKAVQGKIVFFNRPMDPTLINTFAAYARAVDQRAAGPSEAGRLGAIAVIVRSMGTGIEDYPHTGGLRYQPDAPRIPAAAVSTLHAELLSDMLAREKDLRLFLRMTCETLPDAPSFNVIGEIRGSDFPDEIIVVGGHLDSWDVGQGAHDDGAGCVQAMEVLRLMKVMDYRPRRTIRAVMFMNEENGLRGGIEYAARAKESGEKHIAAIESDRGGFTPRGFSLDANDQATARIRSWKPLLSPYGLTDFDQAGGGADIGPLRDEHIALIGFLPDSHRYFRYHHTEEDTFDKVDKRELEMGAASMAALVYLLDQHGIK